MTKTKLEVKKSKVIYNNTTVLDRNFIENPLFICSPKEELSTIHDVESKNELSTEAKKVINVISKNQNKETLMVVYRSWKDSKGDKKELLIANSFPNFQTQDVWNGLIGLYLKKLSPIAYDGEEKSFSIEYDTMEFSLYELAKFMNKSISGKTFDMLDVEILRLGNAKYYTFSSNIIFDKKNQAYLEVDRKGISFIYDYEKSSRKNLTDSSKTDKCTIRFNRVIIDNIRYEYFKYMNPSIYFSLPSTGITRRLYTYIVGTPNTFNNSKVSYIKRNIFLLANKLPIYPQQRSKIKERMSVGLKNLKANGIISDYFYGDEILINNIKEDCIYFITKGSVKDVMDELIVEKQLQLEMSLDEDNDIYIPKDISKELADIGINPEKILDIINRFNRWEIIKFILWLKEESRKVKTNKTSNPAGLFIFAIEKKLINLDVTHKHIVDFIELEKKKSENKKVLTESNIRKMYDKYIKDELDKFKNEDEFGYRILFESMLNNLNAQVDNKISQMQLISANLNNKELDDINKIIKELEEFKEKQDKSKMFKDGFIKEATIYRQLKSYEDYKKECMV